MRELTFGEKIKRKRKLLGLSQKDLAEAVGCHYSMISYIESGQRNDSKLTTKALRYLEQMEKGLTKLLFVPMKNHK